MRRLLALLAALALAPVAGADEPPEKAPEKPAEAAPASAPAEATPPPATSPEAPGYRPRFWREWFPEPTSAPASPFWWGWSWGWGYYPVYPGHDMKRPEGVAFPEPQPDRITTTLHFAGAASSHAGVAGLRLAIDGRRLGFEASVDALALGSKTSTEVNPVSGTQTLGVASAFGTFSFVSERNVRVRLEAGGAVLSIPDAGAYASQPYGGSVLVGPAVGVSMHLGLVGPLGIEGHARLSPAPVLVEDSRLALAFRAGSLAFTYGHRRLRVYGDGKDAPRLSFGGTEVGLAVRF
ncbi:MAG: hypothetical protein QM704_23110 [Anaeromyxobacteraceae bacterium]